MRDRERSLMVKQIIDVVSAILVIVPFICIIWVYILFSASSNGRIGLHPTILGLLPAPLEILVLDIFPWVFGFSWLALRYSELLFKKYPLMKSWKFQLLLPLVGVVLGTLLAKIFGRFGG